MAAMDGKYKAVLFPNGGSVKKVKEAAMAPAMVGMGELTVYRECLKNHAATLGAHALDGCGEFMAMPSADPVDPSTFTCAACGCHRNFHRRVVMEGSPPPPGLTMPPTVLHGQHLNRGEEDRLTAVDADDSDSDSDGSEYDDERSISPPPPLIPVHAHHPAPVPVAQQQAPAPYFASGPHMLMPLGSGAAGAVQRIPAQVSPATAPPARGVLVAGKRFRTKFTAEQKQRMQELSERLGWRLQKRDEAIVDDWCSNIGVSKGVFKVWMHNNKHNYLGGHSARRSASAAAANTPNGHPAPRPFLLSGPAAAAAPPPFNPSTSHSSPAPTTTGFNMNGTAAPAAATAVHPENGTSSQSA